MPKSLTGKPMPEPKDNFGRVQVWASISYQAAMAIDKHCALNKLERGKFLKEIIEFYVTENLSDEKTNQKSETKKQTGKKA